MAIRKRTASTEGRITDCQHRHKVTMRRMQMELLNAVANLLKSLSQPVLNRMCVDERSNEMMHMLEVKA